MKSKLVDTVAYAGNGTIDRLGVLSAYIIISGNGEIKLQHCTTSNGTFTDFATLNESGNCNKGVFVNLESAKRYIKVSGADGVAVILGDCEIDPKEIGPVGNALIGKLYAYTYVEEDLDYIIYTKQKVLNAGEVDIFSPEIDLTYAYKLTKGTLTIASVDSDGKLTDSDGVVYTPVTSENIIM